MDRCKHVGRLRLAQDHSILNPQKWRCVDCQTTESVWACLKCSHVACGHYMEEHALKHFQESRHPLAMEVHERNVFCYLCDDYVLNDNAEGDLKLLRGALSTVVRGPEGDPSKPSRRSLRSLASGESPTSQPSSSISSCCCCGCCCSLPLPLPFLLLLPAFLSWAGSSSSSWKGQIATVCP
ncbi:UNVERIFIED_CONTAM: hypothetical protein FKN15_072802 [Acipenser sinensis]